MSIPTNTPRRLSLQDLHHLVASLPAEMQSDDGGRTIGIANSVIAHFLGRDWFTANIPHTAARPSFLRVGAPTRPPVNRLNREAGIRLDRR
jgi:hypothetical protein